jgi:hypothetical protein
MLGYRVALRAALCQWMGGAARPAPAPEVRAAAPRTDAPPGRRYTGRGAAPRPRRMRVPWFTARGHARARSCAGTAGSTPRPLPSIRAFAGHSLSACPAFGVGLPGIRCRPARPGRRVLGNASHCVARQRAGAWQRAAWHGTRSHAGGLEGGTPSSGGAGGEAALQTARRTADNPGVQGAKPPCKQLGALPITQGCRGRSRPANA